MVLDSKATCCFHLVLVIIILITIRQCFALNIFADSHLLRNQLSTLLFRLSFLITIIIIWGG